MNVLFVSNLFPDNEEPVRGLDNATLLHWLRENHRFRIRVISPRPGFTRRARFPRTGDDVFEPAFPPVLYVPRAGSRWNDRLMLRGLRDQFIRQIKSFHPDVVLGSWLFPDGCALGQLCEQSQIPLVLITQGSDTHQYLEDAVRKRKIIQAIHRSENVICRSGDLANRLSSVGVAREKLTVIYNGIDPGTFFPVSRVEARQRLGRTGENPVLLFVGNLLPVKDPFFLLEVHAALNERRKSSGKPLTQLQLIGQGPLEASLKETSSALGSSRHVEFLGRQCPKQVALHMNAADAFCLTSINEGFPNVLLEAMACELPIVSTDVGGIREKINALSRGRLVPSGDKAAFIEALEETLSETRQNPTLTSEDFGWEPVAAAYRDCLRSAVHQRACGSVGRT